MKNPARFALLGMLVASPALAQSNRVYVGGTLAADSGSRGPVDLGTIATAGGILGLRLSDGWSIEFELNRGIDSHTRQDEAVWLSFAGPNASWEDIQRLGVRARFTRTDTPKAGYSTLVVWRTRERGRVNAALFGGLSWRQFGKRVVRTITHVPPEVPPGSPNVHDDDEAWTLTGGGLTAGFMIPVRVRRSLAIAPELRFTGGFITDEGAYKTLHTGVRVMWGF